jgi:hypothetical protein
VKSHPKSSNLWADAPLNPDVALSQSIAVYGVNNLEAGSLFLPKYNQAVAAVHGQILNGQQQ